MRIELRPFDDDEGNPTGTGCIIVSAGENSVRGIEYAQSANGSFLVICDGGLCVVTEFQLLGRGKWGVENVELTRELFRHRWQNAISDANISDNGQFLCVQLAETSRIQEPAPLHCFDTTSGSLLWEMAPPTGTGRKRYRFDLDAGVVYLCYNDGGQFPYRLSDGAFLGEAAFREQQIARIEAEQLLENAMAEFETLQETPNLTSEERRKRAKAVFELLGKASRRCPKWARPFRVLGEFFEWLPDTQKAMRCYEKALSLNPNAGCRRALSRLQKMSEPTLATGSDTMNSASENRLP